MKYVRDPKMRKDFAPDNSPRNPDGLAKRPTISSGVDPSVYSNNETNKNVNLDMVNQRRPYSRSNQSNQSFGQKLGHFLVFLGRALFSVLFAFFVYVGQGLSWSWRKLRRASKTKSFWSWVLRIVAAGFAVIAFLFIYYSHELPDPNKLLSRSVPQSTQIYSRDGVLLYSVNGDFKRTLIPFSDMNDYIKEATISIEDKNFYNEGGISFTGILRSIFVDITRGSAAQGGSTITQQFVRGAVLTKEKAISRKIKEIILSIEIDNRFSKDDILKLYLNEIPYGGNIYGIQAASQTYFGKDAKDLDLAQAAYLAAIPQSPTFYNPSGPNRDALDHRKNLVLDAMLNQKYISQQQHDDAQKEVVTFNKGANSIKAPDFVFYIENYLSQKYGDQTVQTGGLKVVTTLDWGLQQDAEKAVTDGAAKNSAKYNANNAALVAMDPKTGQILAMVGSKDYFGASTPAGCTSGVNCNFEPQVNVALSPLQPGSSVKPYVYVTAFDQDHKMAPATLLEDIVTDFGSFGGKDYIPHDYDLKERGPVSIRSALAESLNIPAVKTLDLIGVPDAVQTMKAAGITTDLSNCQLSLVLGGCEVTLLDHVNGYSTFATGGVVHPKTGILSVQDSDGKMLEQYQDQSKQVLDPQSVYELISVLTDNAARTPIFGANSPLILPDRPVAAKTGTTQNFHDGWTVGFTPSLVAGVWTGNNDGELLKSGADGVVVAAPIWHAFMVAATKGTPVEAFTEPNGIQHVAVDAFSGMLPGPYTQATKQEVFASYSVPTQVDDTHQLVNGQVVTVLHSEMPDNPNWEDPVATWAVANGYAYTPIQGGAPVDPNGGGTINNGGDGNSQTPIGNPPTVSINSPTDGSTVTSPFYVQAVASPDSGNSITRMDLLIDGAVIQSVDTPSYSFSVNNALGSGSHTIAVQAADDKGNTADTSITVKVK